MVGFLSMRKLKGVIMDLDGTLVDSPLDFALIRSHIGLPPDAPILEAITEFSREAQLRAQEIILSHEWRAAKDSQLIRGVTSFFSFLQENGIRTAIFTRNSAEIAKFVVNRHGLKVDLVVGREDAPPKPRPDGLALICEKWELAKEEVIYLGDYVYDLEAGKNAGVETWLYAPQEIPSFSNLADKVYSSYGVLSEMLEEKL